TAPLHPGWVEVAPQQAEAAEAAEAEEADVEQQRAHVIIPAQILASALEGPVQQLTTVTPQDLADPAFQQDVIESIMDSKSKSKEAAIDFINKAAGKASSELVAALFEAKVKQFARGIASTLCQLRAMPGGTGQYAMLLEHVFGSQGRSAIEAASRASGGENVGFAVEKTKYKKGIDVKLVARTAGGAYITGAGFECKTNEKANWISGGNLATQLVNQASLAAIDGEPVSKMFVMAADVGATWMDITWLDGTTTPSAPHGSKTVAALLHPDARSSHFCSKQMSSVVTRDASGKLVAAQWLVHSPDLNNQLQAVMLMPGDGQGGLAPLVQKAGITVTFDVRAYRGAAINPLTTPSSPAIETYAKDNGLPATLTLAEYNLARALDATYAATLAKYPDKPELAQRFNYKISADGWIKHTANDYSDLTPAERLNNLNVMLKKAMNNLFETTPTTVTFSLGFLVGMPHQALVDTAGLFRR
ncbi:MAG: hypothetical protein Q6365_012995, partial [Candidatus Sigynarchaeota archaeon]